MELTEREKMKIALDRAGITLREMGDEMKLAYSAISTYVSGAREMPADFPSRFWPAYERLAQRKAAEVIAEGERLRAEAEEKARRMIEPMMGAAA